MLIEFEIKIKLPIIAFSGLNFDGFKQFADVICGECRLAKNPHDFNDWSAKFEIVFDDTNEAVSDNCHMDLYSDSVLGFSPKSLDLKMLLNPLEELMRSLS